VTVKQRLTAVAMAVALAIPAEGLRRTAYYDPPGILTVCRGHTGPDVIAGKVYTLAECDAFMSNDMRNAITMVERCAPGLPDHVLAAFGDAVFNLGPKIACDTRNSTAARLLAAGDIMGACAQLPRWNQARIAGVMMELPGLTTRRAAERALCETAPVVQ
jgi:lysozyme